MNAALTLRYQALPAGSRRLIAMLAIAAGVSAAWQPCVAQPSSPKSPFGTQVRVEHSGQRTRGELLAVSADSLWINRDSGRTALARNAVTAIAYRKHDFGARRTLSIGFLTSAVTTLGIGMACAQHESTDEGKGTACGGVTAGWFGVTALATLISGGLARIGEWQKLPPDRWEQLAAHARYPQGLPPQPPLPPPL